MTGNVEFLVEFSFTENSYRFIRLHSCNLLQAIKEM